jgi:hypothetical protein
VRGMYQPVAGGVQRHQQCEAGGEAQEWGDVAQGAGGTGAVSTPDGVERVSGF